jgi:hypothetical protein
MKQKIICFSGQRFNGKDAAADHLAFRLNNEFVDRGDEDTKGVKCEFHRIAFGDAVKRTYMNAFDVDLNFVEKWKPIDDPPYGFEKNIREALMFIGDGFRQINPSVWVDYLFRLLKDKNAIISDGRYNSEVEAVSKRKGVNIAIWRPGFENEIDHPSEAELKPEIKKLIRYQGETGPIEMESPFDYFLVNEGTLIKLNSTIDGLLLPYLKENYLD